MISSNPSLIPPAIRGRGSASEPAATGASRSDPDLTQEGNPDNDEGFEAPYSNGGQTECWGHSGGNGGGGAFSGEAFSGH